MKKRIISVVVIILIAFGVYFILHSGTKIVIAPKETPASTPKMNSIIDQSLAVEKTYTAPDKYTIFKVTYPQFKNTSAEFNQQIVDQVNVGIAQQQKDSSGNWQARYDTQSKGENIAQFPAEADKFYFDVSWKPTQENNQFISMILTISAFEGGAHGYETLTSYNYDVVNKKEVTLADLFPNDPNYLTTLSAFSRKDLMTQFRKKLEVKTKVDEQNFQDTVVPMLTDGTAPSPENFSVFTFTNDAVTIYFNQYQVGPYSMGSSTVIFPRK